MRVKQLDHVNFTVGNLSASVQWYTRVFGFRVVEHGVQNGTDWCIIKSGDAILCLYEAADRSLLDRFEHGDRKLHAVSHFAFRIEDREAWLETIAEQGLQILYDGAIDWPHSTSWYLQDPTGYEIEVALWHDGQIGFDQVSAGYDSRASA